MKISFKAALAIVFKNIENSNRLTHADSVKKLLHLVNIICIHFGQEFLQFLIIGVNLTNDVDQIWIKQMIVTNKNY